MTDCEQASWPNLVSHEADTSLWPVKIERANSHTPFDELAKLLGAVNAHTYQPFFPGENLENFVTQEWIDAKARTFERRALGEAGYQDPTTIAVSAESSKNANSDHRSKVWVAYFGQAIIGMASTEPASPTETVIANLHIVPTYQRKSIGKALLTEALEAAGERDMLVHTHNETAGDFYRKFCFEETGYVETVMMFGALPTTQTTFRLARLNKAVALERIHATSEARLGS